MTIEQKYSYLMRAFLEQTEEELEYLESQVLQVEALLTNKNNNDTWSGGDVPPNLISQLVGDTKKMSHSITKTLRI